MIAVGINRDAAGWWITTREGADVRVWSHADTVADALAQAKRAASIERHIGYTPAEREQAERALVCLNRIEFVAGPDPRD